jgi:hypothetical protein
MQAASTNSAPYAVQAMTSLRKLVGIGFSSIQSSDGGGESRPALECERLTGQRPEAGVAPGPSDSFHSTALTSRARSNYGAQMRRIFFTA